MTYKIEIIIYETCFVHNLYQRKWFFKRWVFVDRQRSNSAFDKTSRQWANEYLIPDSRITFKLFKYAHNNNNN